MARLLMPRYLIPILIALACVGAVTLIDNDGQRAVAQKAQDAQSKKPSVVLIIMDEFPVDQMLRSDGKIDAVRYPNFAALAAGGTWFKNASTTYDSTTRAIPQVMDGKLARRSSTPDFVGHPDSIYTIFGRRGYRIVSSQEATSVCPPRYCPGARRKRPDILPLLQNGRRA
ncbi:MAG TPA: sulfatase-like hydrolase/transferase, partial [Thermoleophilaceae bacterium]|nr:sulfatase-like hydrolase/transferase [Thermoleophilaceae bacterium]